jgi:hypothetical protein
MCTSTFWSNEILPKDEAKIEVILQKWNAFLGISIAKTKKELKIVRFIDFLYFLNFHIWFTNRFG